MRPWCTPPPVAPPPPASLTGVGSTVGCPKNQIHDCLGHCSPIAYIGDKYCDNNNNHNFNCEVSEAHGHASSAHAKPGTVESVCLSSKPEAATCKG